MPTIIVDKAKGLYQKAATSANPAGTLSGQRKVVKNVTAATTLTVEDSSKLIVFNDVDGAVITLPDSGDGDIIGVTYEFALGVTATSNAHKVVCSDTTNEKLFGVLHMSDSDTSDATVGFCALAGDSFSAISSNGSTTGIQGSRYSITCIAADKWQVEGTMIGTGTVATPFASS